MDVQVQSLIDKIKKDGIATAEEKAAAIITEAEQKAHNIVAEAEEKAAGIVKTAKAETERMEKSSVDAIKQAGRNLLLSFRDSINAELASIVSLETVASYSPELLKTLIPETVKAWAKKPDAEDIAVLLSEKDLAALESGFRAALKAELGKGLDLKSDASLSSGFRIGSKDGAAYYDFSSESVADLFAAYLNPRVAAIMKAAAVNL
jgi:V/A-type H+-transporting ATPase subunit E